MRDHLSLVRVLRVSRHGPFGTPLELDSQATLYATLLSYAAFPARRDFLVCQDIVEIHPMLEVRDRVVPFFAD